MITLNDIKNALGAYEKKRQPSKIGWCMYLYDYCFTDPFYSDLKKFYEGFGKAKKINFFEIEGKNLEYIEDLLRLHHINPLTHNNEICELYNAIMDKVNLPLRDSLETLARKRY